MAEEVAAVARCSLGELLEGWVWRRISSALMAWDSEHGEGLARSMGSGAAAMADLNHGLGFELGFERRQRWTVATSRAGEEQVWEPGWDGGRSGKVQQRPGCWAESERDGGRVDAGKLCRRGLLVVLQLKMQLL